MEEQLRILMVDDDEEEYFLLMDLVSRTPRGARLQKFDLDWVSTYEEALVAFSECRYDLYLVDFHLGPRSGLDLLCESVVKECPAPVIMLTGQGSYEVDMAAMQAGAADYLVKGQLTLPLLERSIRYAIERKQVEKDLERLVQERTRDLALLRKQAQEMNALQKATSSLLNTLDLSHLIGQILDAAQEAIPAGDQSWLHLVDQQGCKVNQLTEPEFWDPRIHRLAASKDRNCPLKGICEGHSMLIEDARSEPLLVKLLESEQDWQPIRSAVIAPMVLDKEVIGTLSLSSTHPFVFTKSDLQLLTSFAATAAAAIQNAILYREVQNLATIDPLTGQLNRRAFFELGQRELDRFLRFGHPLSAIMMDVDHFKVINDTYGHSVGDQVLSAIIERCCSVIRQVDVLGRYGGDEFAILLPEADQDIANAIAERIRASISETPIYTEAGPIAASVSLGVSQARQGTDDLTDLLDCADHALYQSKLAGRNVVEVLERYRLIGF